MRHELGLDLPERRIGLSAHDFAQLIGADEVILSHAAKVGGAPPWPRVSCIGWKRWRARNAGTPREAAAQIICASPTNSTGRDKVEPIEQPDAKAAARRPAAKPCR